MSPLQRRLTPSPEVDAAATALPSTPPANRPLFLFSKQERRQSTLSHCSSFSRDSESAEPLAWTAEELRIVRETCELLASHASTMASPFKGHPPPNLVDQITLHVLDVHAPWRHGFRATRAQVYGYFKREQARAAPSARYSMYGAEADSANDVFLAASPSRNSVTLLSRINAKLYKARSLTCRKEVPRPPRKSSISITNALYTPAAELRTRPSNISLSSNASTSTSNWSSCHLELLAPSMSSKKAACVPPQPSGDRALAAPFLQAPDSPISDAAHTGSLFATPHASPALSTTEFALAEPFDLETRKAAPVMASRPSRIPKKLNALFSPERTASLSSVEDLSTSLSTIASSSYHSFRSNTTLLNSPTPSFSSNITSVSTCSSSSVLSSPSFSYADTLHKHSKGASLLSYHQKAQLRNVTPVDDDYLEEVN